MRVTLGILTTAVAASAHLVSSGASVELNDIHYFISPFSQGKVFDGAFDTQQSRSSFGFIPITVVSEKESNLQALFTNWTARDDVWQPGFLETVLVSHLEASAPATRSLYSNTQSLVLPLSENCSIPSGPYFLNVFDGEAYQAYRLYDDFGGAFSQSLLQTPKGDFQTLSAHVPSAASLTIGVPSRLYFNPSKDKPLHGVRIGVKDLFALAGVKSSNGNRAWHDLYPPSNTTGTAMQNLIDAGAVIVGFQKLSQFANGETPTADWVDYHAPFNPRGDGYQNPSSSSSGAGASIASYDWLDLAVGSDTGGSIRGPAGVQGLFGNRPSHGMVSLDNAMPLSPALDTPGFLARDPQLWDAANAVLYKGNYTKFADESTKYPTKIITLGLPENDASPTGRVQRKFAADLAKYLNTTLTSIDIHEQWDKSGPAEANGQSLRQLLNITYTAFIAKQQTELLRNHFYEDYAAKHDGRRPFVDPVALSRWSWGDAQPEGTLSEAIANKTLFMDWFNTKILPPVSNPLTCSSAIVLHVDSSGFFSARNDYLDSPKLPFGFTIGSISVFSGAPDSVYPLGQIPVFSPITNHTEFLPVTVDVMVARGCDGLIARLAQDLLAAGLLKVPKVGAGLDGGDVLLRRYI